MHRLLEQASEDLGFNKTEYERFRKRLLDMQSGMWRLYLKTTEERVKKEQLRKAAEYLRSQGIHVDMPDA